MALKVYESMEINSHDFSQLSCEECARSGYKVKYLNYCTECNRLYCQECISYHQDDVNQGRQDKGSGKLSLTDDHRDQLLYLDNIRGQENFNKIQQSKQKKKVADTKRQLEDLQLKLNKMIQTETSAKQNRLEYLQETTELKMEKLSTAVNVFLDNIKSTTLEKLNTVHTEIENHYGNKLATLTRLQVRTNEALKKISEDENEQTFNEMETVANETKDALNIIEKDVNNYYDNFLENIMKAERQTSVSVLTEAMDGFLCHLYALISQLLEDNQYEDSEATNEPSVPYKEYNIQADTDSLLCDITSCCSMEDGSIILTDWNNSNLKHLSENFDIIDECSLPGLPWTVVAYDNDEVLVSLNLLQRIQWVTIEPDKMMPTKSFKVNQPCKGLAYCWDKIFVSCGGDGILECQGQILVYDTNGNFLQTINQDHIGHKIVSNPQHLHVMQFQSEFKLFIADKELGLIAIQITEGAQDKDNKHEVENIDLKGYISEPKGLCVGKNKKQMYLSDFTQGNIITLEPTEQSYNVTKLMTLDNKSNSVINSICFIEEQQKLILTSRNSNVITVYNISGRK